MTGQPELYEQQPGESKQAYEAFCCYRDAPPGTARSIRSVGQTLGKSGSLISRWSSCWDWGERAQAWDQLIEAKARQQKQETHVAALLDYQKRMASQGRALSSMTAGLSSISGREIIRRVAEPESMTAAELAAVCRAVAALSQVALEMEGASLSVPQIIAAIQGDA